MVSRNAVPWGKPGDTDPDLYAYQDRWRLLLRYLGAGIAGDGGSSAARPWRAWCTNTDTILRVDTADAQSIVEGVHVETPSGGVLTFDLAALGTQPSSSQARVDALVFRYDPAAQDVTVELVTGTPANGTEATVTTRPSLTVDPDPDGVWMEPIAWVTRRGGQPLTSANIVRADRYASALSYCDSGGAKLADLPALIGAAVIRRVGAASDLWVRGRGTSGGGTWLGVTNPAWSPAGWSPVSGVTGSVMWRVSGGRLEAYGQLSRVGSTDFPASMNIGTLSADMVPGLSGPRLLPVATNLPTPARIQVAPQSGGTALVTASCPANVHVIVLDALSVPLG